MKKAIRWSTAFRVPLCSVLVLVALSSVFTSSSILGHNQSTLTNGIAGKLQLPVSGSQSTLVVLVQFPDKSNSATLSTISGMLTGLNKYYAEDSYGMVSFATTLTSSTSQWYTLPQNMEYYASNTVSGDNQLVGDSLQAAYRAGVNFHKYKYAIVVHAGNDEAMPPHVATDIHSFTIPGYPFNPSPLDSFQISTSVVSESDPVGVYCHEAGHLLGLPDLYDLTQQIDPVNNFVGYWEIMALGEWNPNNGNPLDPSPGTYPSLHSAWSKIRLGWISNSSMRLVYPGNLTTVTVQNLELPTNGIQAVKIPISVNYDGTLSYYLVEMRAKLGSYDPFLPFPSDYPGAGLFIYKVNESIAGGHGSLRLIDAHPGGDLSDAGFGPCNSPCVSNNTFSDPSTFLKIIVTTTNSTSYAIIVDRTSSPLLLLQINTPSPGVQVSVDGTNSSTDQSKEFRIPVHLGPHEVYVQARVPVSLGSTSVQVGLTDSFASWDDGNTANPRWVSVSRDTVITATYRVIVEPSFATAATAVVVLGVVATGIVLSRRARRNQLRAPATPQSGVQTAVTTGTHISKFPEHKRVEEGVARQDKQMGGTDG